MKTSFGWVEDNFQPNKNALPSLQAPYYSAAKAQLTWTDLEALRIKGPGLLRRANELSGKAGIVKPEIYVLELDDSIQEIQACRLKLFKDDKGKIAFELFRINSTAMPGCKVEVSGSKVICIYLFIYLFNPPQKGILVHHHTGGVKESCGMDWCSLQGRLPLGQHSVKQ